MKKSELRKIIKEEIQNVLNEEKNYYSKIEILNDYLNDNISLDEMINIAGGLKNVATEEELTGFLNNDFLLKMQAETHDISEEVLIKKIKELLMKY